MRPLCGLNVGEIAVIAKSLAPPKEQGVLVVTHRWNQTGVLATWPAHAPSIPTMPAPQAAALHRACAEHPPACPHEPQRLLGSGRDQDGRCFRGLVKRHRRRDDGYGSVYAVLVHVGEALAE